jgi:hypothetical protein
MPEPVSLDQVAALAAQLPSPDRRKLAETLLRELAAEARQQGPPRCRLWREIRGSVPYPQCGEDAQTWVSRGRRESDEQRERQWRNG